MLASINAMYIYLFLSKDDIFSCIFMYKKKGANLNSIWLGAN